MQNKLILFSIIFILGNVVNAYDFQYRPIHILENSMNLIEDNIQDFSIQHIHDIYPIGWSDDGKFAYIQHRHWDESNNHSYRLIIQSMVTDNIIWENDYFNVFRLIEDANYEQYEKLQKIYFDVLTPEFYYQYKKDEIDAALKKYNIIQIEPSFIQGFPITTTSSVIDIHLNELAKEELREDMKGLNFFRSYTYNIEVSNNNENKIIHSNHLEREEVIGSQIVGYLKSPFEDRIAVIVAYFHWDRHLTHYVRFEVVGCDISYGFK